MARRLVITSDANPWFVSCKHLLKKKGMQEAGQCLIPGTKLIQEYLQNQFPETLANCTLITPMGAQGPAHPLVREAYLAPALFQQLDVTHNGQALLLAPLPTPAEPTGERDIVYLPCGDPQNLGAILRAAECLNPADFILLKGAAFPFLQQSIRASHGSVFRLRLSHKSESTVVTELVYALDLSGKDLREWKRPSAQPLCRFLFGTEGEGLEPVLHQFSQVVRLTIPMRGGESLNVAQSAAILFYKRD